MSDTTNSVSGNSALVDKLNQPSASQQAAAAAKPKDNKTVGKDEFLQLLITQLKNQDPTSPEDPKEFVTGLAQLTQVEQLTQMNAKLGALQGSDTGSLASYLGHEVTLKTDKVDVAAHDGGELKINLIADAKDVKVDLLGSDGTVKETIDVGALSQGKHTVPLKNLKTMEGEFKYSVHATDGSGGSINNDAKVAGIVTGFIPGVGDAAKLIVGSREVSPADITEVGLGS